MNKPSRLFIRDWTKSFGATRVLQGLSLTVEPGEWLSLLGPSGCGKTTVLRCISGFESLDSGTAFLGETDLLSLPPQRRPVHTVFQSYALFPHLSVFENVAFGLRIKGVSRAEARDRVSRMLEQVHLTGLDARKPQELSGGQQQRVALARALILRPQVLLLDEPLGALDAGLRRNMQMELKRLQRELEFSCILVTHDQEEALRVSDRIALLKAGKVEQCDSPQRLYQVPISKYAASFLGLAHFLEVTLREEGEAWRVTCMGVSWLRPKLPDGGSRPDFPFPPDPGNEPVPALLCLRPEEWRIEFPAGEAMVAQECVRLPGRLQGLVFQGETWRAFVQLASGAEIEVALDKEAAQVWESTKSFPMPVHIGFPTARGVLLPPETKP